MAKKKQTRKKSRSKKQLKKEVLRYFEQQPRNKVNYKQLAHRLGAGNKKEREKVLVALEELYVDGVLEEVKPGKYKQKIQSHYITGTIEITSRGFGFVSTAELDEDIFIPPHCTHTSLTGDEVKVLLYAKRRGDKPEGEVAEVLKRKKTEFTGVLEVSENFAFLVPDARKMDVDIFIPLEHIKGGRSGDKALVEITEWPESAKSPFGKVKKILGKAGEHFAEMHAIISEFSLPVEFPGEVIKEAEKIPASIPNEVIQKRKDLRKLPLFTIDPEDAKDFDDALSIRKIHRNTWEVGVHIADVTHYVRPGTELDKEAFNRGTSVYLVDRVIPMLPEKLSNGLCSLKPNEDRLAFSAIFHIDDRAKIKKEWFGRTIVRSDRRFSYEEAQQILETGEGEFSGELIKLNELAKVLREKKFEEGAISFETEEVKFKLDGNGKPLEIIPKVRKEAHMLIEDFMLLANRKVAEFIFKKEESFKETPFVYRVHDAPPKEKLDGFVKIARRFGYEIKTGKAAEVAASFNRLLDQVEGRPEQNLLEKLAIRTMSKAFYTTKKSGHYGLAFDYYTHFTSPIRRYPDVIAHRLLDHYLNGSGKKIRRWADEIERQCKHASEMEVRAEESERASVKFKQVEYMKDHVGEEFDGIISGMVEAGLFVELIENKCEGMVTMNALADDYYIFDEDNYLIRGMHTHKTYQLGDKVRVSVLRADPVKRELDLDLA